MVHRNNLGGFLGLLLGKVVQKSTAHLHWWCSDERAWLQWHWRHELRLIVVDTGRIQVHRVVLLLPELVLTLKLRDLLR